MLNIYFKNEESHFNPHTPMLVQLKKRSVYFLFTFYTSCIVCLKMYKKERNTLYIPHNILKVHVISP